MTTVTRVRGTWCRLCQGLCGVRVTVDTAGRIVAFHGEEEAPTSAGHLCEVGRQDALRNHQGPRLERPLRRTADGWQEVPWAEALAAVGAELGRIRGGGARSVGFYAGQALAHDGPGAVRLAALAVALGTPNLFSPLDLHGGPRLRAAEGVMGLPLPLQADVGRAHTVLVLGADPGHGLWGPLQAGSVQAAALRYFRRTRKSKLWVVNPAPTALSAEADLAASLRPGTEAFLLLGMASQVLANGWEDAQFVRDHTVGAEELRRWLAPWTPERVARLCGLTEGTVRELPLKLSRAAMATIVPGPAVFRSRHATVAAWAWHVVLALTANLFRPGGAYAAPGAIELDPVLASLPGSRAPRTRVAGTPLLLLQAPSSELADEVLTPGADRLRALVVVDGDPLAETLGGATLSRALEELELLVVLASRPGPLTERAHWVLPVASSWERRDLQLLHGPVLPARSLAGTAAVVDPPGEARPTSAVLQALWRALPLGTGWRDGAHGLHLRAAGAWLAGHDEGWMDRLLAALDLPDRDWLEQQPAGWYGGELDRASWRVEHAHGRLDLAPAALASAVAGLADPERPAELPLRLHGCAPWAGQRGRTRLADAVDPGIQVPPEAGLADGARVRVASAHGVVEGVARVVVGMHPDAVSIPWGSADVSALVNPADRDPLSGVVHLEGVPVRVERL